MEAFIQFLISIGGPGMFVAALLAGSVAPFASEVVMVGLHQCGISAVELFIWGSVGNTLGGVFNYWVGSLGNPKWIGRLLHIKPEKMERGIKIVQKHGAWSGLLAWIPLLGSVITVSLGLMRVNFWRCTLAFAVGKMARYLVVLFLSGMMS